MKDWVLIIMVVNLEWILILEISFMKNKLTGKVFSGLKQAQEYLKLQPYQEKIEQAVGFKPFAGTLNLRVNPKDLIQLKTKVMNPKTIEQFEHQGETMSKLDIYPVKVENIESAYINIEITDYGNDVMEIIAQENLRNKLNLKDGDKLEVKY